jgi:hypothetical protein
MHTERKAHHASYEPEEQAYLSSLARAADRRGFGAGYAGRVGPAALSRERAIPGHLVGVLQAHLGLRLYERIRREGCAGRQWTSVLENGATINQT